VVRSTSEKLADHIRSAHFLALWVERGQVSYSSQADGRCNSNGIRDEQRTAFWQTVSAGSPKREVPPRRVPDHNHACRVQWVLPLQLPQVIYTPGNVLERASPTTSRIIDAAVLQIPRGQPYLRKGTGYWVHQVQVSNSRSPAAPMNHDCYRERTRTVWESELAKLE
jgi:hypothetical protein